MPSEFDRLVDRHGTNSMKWDVADGELPMWVADMDFPTAPSVLDALRRKIEPGILGYGVVPPAFALAVRNWWRDRHGFTMDPDWITFSGGVVPALSSTVRTLTAEGDSVLVTPPVYNVFYSSIRNSGRVVLASELTYDGDAYSIDWDDLEMKLTEPRTTLFILCNPHNPTGTIWSRSELARIGELCAKHGVTVVSDEIHCDLTAPGVRYTPFASASPVCADVSVTCVSPSKAFNLAGVHSAAVVIPNEDLRSSVVRGLNRDEVAEPNVLAIEAAIAAFTGGGEWLDDLRAYLFENRRHAVDRLAREVPEVTVVDAQSTYLMWIDCSAITDDASDLCEDLRRRTGLILSAGASYGPSAAGFLRMNLACPRSRLDDGLGRLRDGIAAASAGQGVRPRPR